MSNSDQIDNVTYTSEYHKQQTDFKEFLEILKQEIPLDKKKDSLLVLKQSHPSKKKSDYQPIDLQNPNRFLVNMDTNSFNFESESLQFSKDYIVSKMLQYLIYLMNDNTLRRDIMQYYINYLELNELYKWCGTLNLILNKSNHQIVVSKRDLEESSFGQFQYEKLQQVQQQFNFQFNDLDYKKLYQLVKTNKSKFTEKDHNLFTVVLVYDGHACHYVSFIYQKMKRVLITFDSGILLYPRGQDTIVPMLRKVFIQLNLIDSKDETDDTNNYDLGRCVQKYCGKQYGIQFNGETNRKLPADAFCQSWTIFFLYRYMVAQGDLGFIKDWCRVPPKDRECFVLTFFLIPTLLKFERAKYKYLSSLKDIIDEGITFNEVIHILTSYVEKNMLHRFKDIPIQCPIR